MKIELEPEVFLTSKSRKLHNQTYPFHELEMSTFPGLSLHFVVSYLVLPQQCGEKHTQKNMKRRIAESVAIITSTLTLVGHVDLCNFRAGRRLVKF